MELLAVLSVLLGIYAIWQAILSSRARRAEHGTILREIRREHSVTPSASPKHHKRPNPSLRGGETKNFVLLGLIAGTVSGIGQDVAGVCFVVILILGILLLATRLASFVNIIAFFGTSLIVGIVVGGIIAESYYSRRLPVNNPKTEQIIPTRPDSSNGIADTTNVLNSVEEGINP